MASRMDRYNSEKAKATRRSQKNRILYQQIDDLMHYPAIQDEEDRLGTTRIERLFENYDTYKTQENKRSYREDTKKRTWLDEEEENYLVLKRMNESTLENLQKYRLPKGITVDEDKKIKQMISTITTPSRLDRTSFSDRDLSSLKELYDLDQSKKSPKKSIESLLDEAKFLVQKKRNEFKLKEMNDIIHPYGSEQQEEMRKFNLKVKYTSLALFFILSFIIFLLILNAIR